MKTLKTILAAALLLLTASTFADELVVNDFSIKISETAEVAVELNNPDTQYIMTEFWMTLPPGVTIAKDEDDEFLFEESSRFDRTHSLVIAWSEASNAYHFLIYSTRNKALKGTSGALFTLTLQADATAVPGTYECRLYNLIFSDPDENEVNPAESTFQVTVTSESTGLDAVRAESVDEDIFDLQGRKVSGTGASAAPLKKGVYVTGGHKVLVGDKR